MTAPTRATFLFSSTFTNNNDNDELDLATDDLTNRDDELNNSNQSWMTVRSSISADADLSPCTSSLLERFSRHTNNFTIRYSLYDWHFDRHAHIAYTFLPALSRSCLLWFSGHKYPWPASSSWGTPASATAAHHHPLLPQKTQKERQKRACISIPLLLPSSLSRPSVPATHSVATALGAVHHRHHHTWPCNPYSPFIRLPPFHRLISTRKEIKPIPDLTSLQHGNRKIPPPLTAAA